MAAFPTSDMAGHQQLHERVTAALDRCQESRDVEFKESASWKCLRPRLIKTALAMANLRDGGIIVIGASERDESWKLSGITDEDLNTYDPDDVISAINTHASPHVDVDVVVVKHRNGSRFLAIQIHEFGETPVICEKELLKEVSVDGRKKDPDKVLFVGDIVVRPMGQARSTKAQNAQQLHELLELAAEKRARRILATARHVGLKPSPTQEQHYQEELDHADADRVKRLSKVPRWEVVLRPTEYHADRIGSISDARTCVQRCHVRRGGWSYPIVLRPEEYRGAGSNWVSGFIDCEDRPEEWRLFFSGQFHHQCGISSAIPGPAKDMHQQELKQHLFFRHDVPWTAIQGYIDIQTAIYFLTVVFEFAARLGEQGVLGAGCTVCLAMRNILNVALTASPRRSWHDLCLAGTNNLNTQWEFEVDALIADRVTPVIDAAVWFFERFNWDNPSREVIRQDVEAFRSGK